MEDEEDRLLESRLITQEFVKKLFKQISHSNKDPAKQQEILNEYLADEILDQVAALLSKQFMESEILLKQLMHKYIQLNLAEHSSIKTLFKADYDALNELKLHMNNDLYTEQLKKLRLNEE